MMSGPSDGSGNWQISEVTDLKDRWEHIAPRLQRALNQGQGDGMPADELLPGFEAGTRQLWAIHDQDELVALSVIGVELIPQVGYKVVVQYLEGERMDEWIQFLVDTLWELKEMIGGFCIEASCRPGLAKYMKRLGWSQKAVIMEFK